MKIRSIHFKNINSLRGEHTIDFTKPPLDKAGLFAITGKTGSGKSTLLDVISLALYSQTPRLSQKITTGAIETTGTILTRNTKEAYAEVVYECRYGEYRSRWSISTNRNGRLRDYEMELSDNQTGKLLDLKKSDVPPKNEELVGLSYSQFIRSILLAQGDFARFLQSGRAERGELLEKITGSWIYRELGKKAYEWSKKYREEMEKKQDRKNQIRESLMNEEDYKQAQEDYEAIKKQIKESEENQKWLENAIKQKDQIQEAYDFYHQAVKKEQEAMDRLKNFDKTHGDRLEKHKNLIPYAEELQQWEQLTNQLEKHKDKYYQYQQALHDAREGDRKAHRAIETFIGEKMKRRELIPALEKHEQKVMKLSREIEELQN
ncbi:MAG: AAA family ATPase, partial [Desulfobacterales bacterium]